MSWHQEKPSILLPRETEIMITTETVDEKIFCTPAAPLLQLERAQMASQKKTRWALLHGAVALPSRILSSTWPAL